MHMHGIATVASLPRDDRQRKTRVNMSTAKKLIKGILEGGFEAAKDSVKQVTDTVSPTALVEHALGTNTQQPNELTEYLKTLSPDLTAEELEKKKKEFTGSQDAGLEEARKTIRAALPDHMKLPEKPRELTPYEQTIQDMERKKAGEVEMQKKQQSQVVTPVGKQQQGGLLARKKRPASSSFETSMNIKIG